MKFQTLSLLPVVMALVLLTACTGQPSPTTSTAPTAIPASTTVVEPTISPPSTAAEASSIYPYTVTINPADFVVVIDNPYMPLISGTTLIYEGTSEEGTERTEVRVLTDTKTIMGVTATVVRDTVYLDGVLLEDTFDWFAQDQAGNVWYFGEAVDNYEDGVLQDHDGSWEAGVDGALPGIVMHATPADHIGVPYRQEYYVGEAEDMATILSVSERVTVPAGAYENVLQTQDWNPLEPGVSEHKYYAVGIGMIKAVGVESGQTEALIEVITP